MPAENSEKSIHALIAMRRTALDEPERRKARLLLTLTLLGLAGLTLAVLAWFADRF